MTERKVKVTLPNIGVVDATPVQVVESLERWSEVKLDDGTTLRIKPVVMTVNRIDGHYDAEGNPMYAVQAGQAMTANAPDHLRKSTGEPTKVH